MLFERGDKTKKLRYLLKNRNHFINLSKKLKNWETYSKYKEHYLIKKVKRFGKFKKEINFPKMMKLALKLTRPLVHRGSCMTSAKILESRRF